MSDAIILLSIHQRKEGHVTKGPPRGQRKRPRNGNKIGKGQ